MAKNKLTVIDKGFDIFQKVAKELNKGKRGVRMGVVGEKAAAQHDNSELSVADLAMIHEFGLGVPRRPFVVPAAEVIEKDLYKASITMLVKVMNEVEQGGTNKHQIIENGYENIAQVAEEKMKEYVLTGQVSPSSDNETGTTLVGESRQLVDAIGAYVETKYGRVPRNA